MFQVDEDEEKKKRLERAQKFGMVTPEVMDERLKLRQQKFGITGEDPSKKVKK